MLPESILGKDKSIGVNWLGEEDCEIQYTVVKVDLKKLHAKEIFDRLPYAVAIYEWWPKGKAGLSRFVALEVRKCVVADKQFGY